MTVARRRPRLALALGTLTLVVGALEAGGRLLGVDYERKAAAYRRLPIYYRQPTLRDGAFLRRPGPAEWRGRVLTEGCRQQGFPGIDLGDEPVVARYDADGLRNPPGLDDWEVAVAGDSFLEAGYLPDDELLTAVLARRAGRRVKNLGVSFTSTLTQTWLLRRFGRAASTRVAVVAFYEGNDVEELEREAALAAAPPDPSAPADLLDALPPQSSFVQAALRLVGPAAAAPTADAGRLVNADFVGGAAAVPMTIHPPPADPADLGPAARDRVEAALRGWAATCRELGLEPWLLFLPCKLRALHGHLRLRPSAGWLAAWRPDGAPAWVEARCRGNGIRFIDATPALAAAAARGVLPYNAVWDTHLDRDGHEVVGGLLAEALAARGP